MVGYAATTMAQRVTGEDRTFRHDDAEIRVHVARAETTGAKPGLVILPDVFGLSDHYRDVARRFAAEGCVALVLDPYSREGTPKLADMEAVFRWMSELPDERVLGDVRAAVDYLLALPEVGGAAAGITGFCMGGQYALMAACTIEKIGAAVSWYGMLRYQQTNALKPASPLALAPNLKCPYLGLFGADDAIIPGTDVDELRAILAGAGKVFEIEVYEGAGHAFFNDTRPEMYRPETARLAFQRAMTFLRRHLP